MWDVRLQFQSTNQDAGGREDFTLMSNACQRKSIEVGAGQLFSLETALNIHEKIANCENHVTL